MEKSFLRNINYYSQHSVWGTFSLEPQPNAHEIETWKIENLKIIYHMNLTYFHPRIRNVENNNNCPLNIRFVVKTSDIRNFPQNIGSDNTGYHQWPCRQSFLKVYLPVAPDGVLTYAKSKFALEYSNGRAMPSGFSHFHCHRVVFSTQKTLKVFATSAGGT